MQKRNSRAKRYEYKGESLMLVELIEKYSPSLKLPTVWARLNRGEAIDEALRPLEA